LVFIDNSVNPDTGTVMLKAEVPNRDVQLWPGQFVGVNTRLTLQANAVVIPSTAIQTGQDGNFVYEVTDGKAQVQQIKVDRQLGDLAVISSGLKGGERISTRVSRNLRPGLTVIPNASTVAAPAAAQDVP
ncbi:MAG: efflux RND transporter periplasmic adaptor subunit, partial [Gammaproteobacteria bacterium]